MSEKPFKGFLVKQLLKWADSNMSAGFRYQFKSPDETNSSSLLAALHEHTTSSVKIKDVDIPVIVGEQINLIPVLHGVTAPGYSENFISHIRDTVAAQQGDFKNAALLIIHNSMLDTLINSAADLAQQDNVWHPDKIKEDLQGLINRTDIQDKVQVSECLLNHVFEQIVEDGGTVFGFENLYLELLDGDLTFSELGLLNDK